MKKLLFVCHGNICRSPMAEFAMRDLLRQRGLAASVSVASAGTSMEELGNPVYPPAQRILRAKGIDPAGKIARQVRREDYHQFDALIAMDAANLHNMKRIVGEDPEGKLFRLLDLTEHPRDIADPWYTGDFQATWDDIEEGCSALFHWLIKMGKTSPEKST